jgi:HlyD family secretion protein
MTKKESNKNESKLKKSSAEKLKSEVVSKAQAKRTKEIEERIAAEEAIAEIELGHTEHQEKPAERVVSEVKAEPVSTLKFSSKITTLDSEVDRKANADLKKIIQPIQNNSALPASLGSISGQQKAPLNQKPEPNLMMKTFDKLVNASDVAINYMVKHHNDPERSEVLNHTRSPAVFGIWVALLTLFTFFVWGGLAPIDQAAVADGTLVLESQKRIIQHPYGGIIDKIFVKEGDYVTKGQLLITLNKVEVKASRDDAFYKYMTALAENARLIAQRDNSDKILYPDELLANAGNDKISKIIFSQDRIFNSRKEAIETKVKIENSKIQQLRESKKSLTEILETTENKYANFKSDLEAYRKISGTGGVSPAELRKVENQLGQAQAERVEYTSKLSNVEEDLAKEELTISGIKNDYLQETVQELRRNMQELVSAKEHFIQLEDRLARSEIRSPATGQVSNLVKTYTDGGYLQQIQQVMEIIPQNDNLVADVQVSALDIDIVRKGQTALVMIMPFKNRVVPKIKGKVVLVSPDAIVVNNGPHPFSYYNARIELDPKELENVRKTKGIELYPGMPVNAFIEIGPRTLLRYLLDPFLMSFGKAFREE